MISFCLVDSITIHQTGGIFMDGRRPSFFYRVFVFIVTAVVSVTALAVLAVGLLVYRVSQNGDVDATAVVTEMDKETEVFDPDVDLQDSIPVIAQPIAEGYTNILLLGTDREQNGVSRADVIMVCSIDKANNKMLITSFLRDLYLPIPGYTDNRINASYALGGAPLLRKCLLENFGISIDHTMEIDFEGFSSVIDALNGVGIQLDREEAAYLGVGEGKQILTGSQALQYVRMRSVGNGDFDRTLRQQKMLAAIGLRFSEADAGDMYRCVKNILGKIKTDMGIADLLVLLPDIITIVGNKDCESLQIPVAGMYENAEISGMQVLLPDIAGNWEELKRKLETMD
jgi:LCP family protein required for cell wall assembly